MTVSFMHTHSMTWLIRRLSSQDTLPVVPPLLACGPSPITPRAFHAAGLMLWDGGLGHAMFPSCSLWFIWMAWRRVLLLPILDHSRGSPLDHLPSVSLRPVLTTATL